MTKINVSLGITLCTNPDLRNFIRVGVEAQDIDIEGDVEAQAQAAITAALKVTHILDDGLKETVTDIIMDSDKPGLVREMLKEHDEKLVRAGRIMSGLSGRLAEAETKLKELAEPTSEDTPSDE